MTRRTPSTIALLLCLVSPRFAAARPEGPTEEQKTDNRTWYWREDHDYFAPPKADIRASQTHMRLYRDGPVPFTPKKGPGHQLAPASETHLFWDVAFSRIYHIVGVHFEPAPPVSALSVEREKKLAPELRGGASLFVEPAVHMLLDFGADSNAILNSDFRLGGGIAVRLPGSWSWLSARGRFFHESTHLGDDYLLGALAAEPSPEAAGSPPIFHRYNVSYEAVDLFGAAERNLGRHFRVRGYAGHRWINADSFEEHAGDEPVRGGDAESQLGFELNLDTQLRLRERGIPTLGLPSNAGFFLAGDFYRRALYDTQSPSDVWGKNLVLGVAWKKKREDFGSSAPVTITINRYDGPNAHGQFRTERLRYWALGVSIGY